VVARDRRRTYTRNSTGVGIKTPEQMATELKQRFASAVLQSPACKHVRISYEPVGEESMKVYLDGWSLTFNVGHDVTPILPFWRFVASSGSPSKLFPVFCSNAVSSYYLERKSTSETFEKHCRRSKDACMSSNRKNTTRKGEGFTKVAAPHTINRYGRG
jgi:hypothetical protein